MVGTSASRRVPAGICQLAEFDEIPVKRPPCLIKNAGILHSKKTKRREEGTQDDQRNDEEQLRASKQPDRLEVRPNETRVVEGNEDIKKKKKAKKQKKNMVDQANNNTVAEEPAQLSRRLSRRQSIVDPTFSPKISPVMATRLDTLFYGDDDCSEHRDDTKEASANSIRDKKKKRANDNAKR